MLSIIDRYLLRETLKGLLAILSVLLLILVSHAFITNLRRVAAGALTQDVMLDLLGLEIARLLGVLLPAAYFFAILYTLGRMYRDNEMTAFSSCGLSIFRIYRSFFLSMLPLAGLVAWLTISVLPWANQYIEEIRHAQKSEADVANVAAGRFNEFSKGDLVFYAEGLLPNKQMHNVFVQNRQHGDVGLITAEEGYQYVDEKTGDRFVVLVRGYRYEGVPGLPNYSVSEFEKYAVRVLEEDEAPASLRRKSRSSDSLWESDSISDNAEFQYRLAFPLAVVVFTLVGVPLSRSAPRQGVYGRLFIAFLVYFTFFNLLGVSGTWMKDGVTPEWLGRWWVHLLMLCMAAPLALRDSMWTASFRRWVSARASGKKYGLERRAA